MRNSIETIWKAGFLHEEHLVVPQINELYNRKSFHLVDRLQRRLRLNLVMILVLAILFPVIGLIMQVIWQGIATSLLLFLTAGYNKRQIDRIRTLDHGATSFDYLRSLDRWLNDVLTRSVTVARFSYPLYFLIAVSIVWAVWNEQTGGELTVAGAVAVAVATLVVFYFSGRIYRWDVRLMYGRVFRKLEQTIAEMERLRQG